MKCKWCDYDGNCELTYHLDMDSIECDIEHCRSFELEDDYSILDDLGHMHECERDYGYDGEY